MNQVTNLTQWKNLKQEQRAKFDFRSHEYQYQTNASRMSIWKKCTGVYSQEDTVYRLVIEDDKYYFISQKDFLGDTLSLDKGFIILGEELKKHNDVLISDLDTLRPARPYEIPQPEKTLEQKIQEKWPDKEVVMLNWTALGTNGDAVSTLVITYKTRYNIHHSNAQSMKGFFSYVYEINGVLTDDCRTMITEHIEGKRINHLPLASLFEKGGES